MNESSLKSRLDLINYENIETINFSAFVSCLPFINDLQVEDNAMKICKQADRKGNGYIDIIDFRHLLNHLCGSITDQELDELISIGDPYNNGYINYEEFMKEVMK